MAIIDSFRGGYAFLSNFYECPVEFEGMLYNSAEHAYQAAKTLDLNLRKKIASKSAPKKAKSAGRRIPLRDDWEYIKDSVMEEIVRRKFTDNEELKKLLLMTNGHELVEGNSWNDIYWGVSRGKGQNKLGKILMKVRKELRS